MKKEVQVLLSSYNGAEYLASQVESILSQKSVRTHILIRDDGSTDETIKVIVGLKEKYPSQIDYFEGKNLGYKKSFLELCQKTNKNFDYFAFSDQDDYWLPNKLEQAIRELDNTSKEIKLYASTVTICDSNLNVLYKKNIDNFVNTFGSALNRIRLAGCTYVFSKEVLNLLANINLTHIPSNAIPSHDGLLFTMCKAMDGFVYVDKDSYILHRRREGSVTSGGNGLLKRIKVEQELIFKNKNDKSYLAKVLKDNFEHMIPPNNMKIIDEILTYKSSFLNRLSLINDASLNSGVKLANIECKIKILTGNF